MGRGLLQKYFLFRLGCILVYSYSLWIMPCISPLLEVSSVECIGNCHLVKDTITVFIRH